MRKKIYYTKLVGREVDVVSTLLLCKVWRAKVSKISTWDFKSFSISPTLILTTRIRVKFSATPDRVKSSNWRYER